MTNGRAVLRSCLTAAIVVTTLQASAPLQSNSRDRIDSALRAAFAEQEEGFFDGVADSVCVADYSGIRARGAAGLVPLGKRPSRGILA